MIVYHTGTLILVPFIPFTEAVEGYRVTGKSFFLHKKCGTLHMYVHLYCNEKLKAM